MGIFTHPENWKITSSNSNSNDTEKLRKIAELLKGSPIDDKRWTSKNKAIGVLDKLLNKTESKDNLDIPKMTVEKLIDTYKGIDWMRLLNGIFRDINIDIKLQDLVQVPDRQYLLQLSKAISNQTKE